MKEKFNKAILLSKSDVVNTSIGIQKEKILHKIIKYYLNNDPTFHEIKVGRMYADVVKDDIIYEIQTQHFNALRNKLDKFLLTHNVVIVYPTFRNKIIHSITENGEYIKTTKSPKKGTPFQLFVELYKISKYLNHPNLKFKVLYLDIEEYRTVVPKKHYRSQGYIKYMQVPLELINEYNFNDFDDFKKLFLEFNITKTFTAIEFSKKTKISYNKSTVALRVLSKLDVVEIIGKDGRKNLWNVKLL